MEIELEVTKKKSKYSLYIFPMFLSLTPIYFRAKNKLSDSITAVILALQSLSLKELQTIIKNLTPKKALD